jgi:hypothetical protein
MNGTPVLHRTVALLIALIVTGTFPSEESRAVEKASPDLRHFWRFDTDKLGQPPAGFSAVLFGKGPAVNWKVEADPQAPSVPNRLVQSTSCPSASTQTQPECLQLLLVDELQYEYPDLTVRLRFAPKDKQSGSGGGAAGIVFKAEKDGRSFYAAIVDPVAEVLDVIRVADGQVTVLGRQPVKLKPVAWHTLRVQHNTILSKDYLEISFDGQIVFTHWDQKLGAGQIGLVTRGEAPVWFDNFDAVQLFSQRPLSPPAAY